MMCEIPLTPEQRDFATENHDLVNDFLKSRHLSKDEYYDIVVFAYLNAVKDYLTKPTARQFSIKTIAFRQMRFCLLSHYRAQYRQKRHAQVVSLHESMYSDTLPLEETIPSRDYLMEKLESELLLHDISNHLTKQQLDTVRLKSYGYNTREIAYKQKITAKRVKELLDEARNTLLKLAMNGE